MTLAYDKGPEFSGELAEPRFWIRGEDAIMKEKKETHIGALG